MLRRVILVLVGFGVAFTGWALVLSVLLAYIGLPLFIFGIGLMQSAAEPSAVPKGSWPPSGGDGNGVAPAPGENGPQPGVW